MNTKISENTELLQIVDLRTSFFTGESQVRAVDGVSFSVRKGEIFGIVGESGSGKTVTSLSILRLVQPPGKIVGGNIFFEGRDLLDLAEREMEEVRGSRIGMVFQEPMTSLNPVFRIGEQIAETIAIHHKDFSHMQIQERALELLTQVGFDEPEKNYLQYPHQLSGGQRQRVLIAIAISCNPSLVIADEPTKALDVATESQIINLFLDIRERSGISMLFVSHDLNVVRFVSDNIIVMYQGRVVEQGERDEVFFNPLHPYTKMLLNASKGEHTQPESNGTPDTFTGCPYYPKGDKRSSSCEQSIPSLTGTEKHGVACFVSQ